jgi:hypothetical protein
MFRAPPRHLSCKHSTRLTTPVIPSFFRTSAAETRLSIISDVDRLSTCFMHCVWKERSRRWISAATAQLSRPCKHALAMFEPNAVLFVLCACFLDLKKDGASIPDP